MNFRKPKKAETFSHELFGNGHVTTLLGVVVYVRIHSRDMPCAFLVRDVQWDTALQCWTLKDNFERID